MIDVLSQEMFQGYIVMPWGKRSDHFFATFVPLSCLHPNCIIGSFSVRIRPIENTIAGQRTML